MKPVLSKSALVAIGGALVAVGLALPHPWGVVLGAVGGLLKGGALLKRPGDVKIVDVNKVQVPR
jgi:hypothetical protein